MKLPDSNDESKIRILALATSIECNKESVRRFVFIKAVMTPNLDKPSKIPMYSGLFSKSKATQSPFLSLYLFKNTLAIRFA